MIGKRRREKQRERGRIARANVFARLDYMAKETVAFHQLRDAEGEESARTRFPPKSAKEQADMIDVLAGMCGRDVNNLLYLVGAWADVYEKKAGAGEEEDGVGAIHLWALTTIGNLFGEIPADAPAFRADLADEGKRRGWRR